MHLQDLLPQVSGKFCQRIAISTRCGLGRDVQDGANFKKGQIFPDLQYNNFRLFFRELL